MSTLLCPRDGELLNARDDALWCPAGHRYLVVDGIALLLDPTVQPTQPGYWATAEESYPSDERAVAGVGEVDEYVRWLLRSTCGNLYDAERISRYPIPAFPLAGAGRLLDLGSNWGRWTIAAARAGFEVVGIDPSLGAVRAARRVASQLNVEAEFVIADARHLPFSDGSFDVVFSYSVLQHLAAYDVAEVLGECARVLRPGGIALHQLPSVYGALSVYRQARRGFRPARGFEVRYWRPRELRNMFRQSIGPTTITADGYLTINPHAADLSELRAVARAVVRASRTLTELSRRVPVLSVFADSLWVQSTRREAGL